MSIAEGGWCCWLPTDIGATFGVKIGKGVFWLLAISPGEAVPEDEAPLEEEDEYVCYYVCY